MTPWVPNKIIIKAKMTRQLLGSVYLKNNIAIIVIE